MSSSEHKHRAVDQWLPVGVFIGFFMAIVAATLYYTPSWGLMDDFGLLKMARELKADPHDVHVVSDNFITSGMLRPFYYSWAAFFYGVFERWPTGFYLFIAVWNMAAIVFWGIVFFKLFNIRREDRYWTIFFYPLTFFIFTPFWNIFNYLSLQEKFVVFFAPLAIYFFQKLYKNFNKNDLIGLCLSIACGLMSKATFVYVPCVFFVYALADLLILHYRPKTSWPLVWINGLIFAAYAAFTLMFQIQGNYTSKYKNGLAGGAFLGKILQLTVVMKFLLVLGIVGFLGLIAYSVLQKRKEYSLGILIYAGLVSYIVLLIPWGFQSYLVSAIAPLALGGLFPVYAWLNAKDGVIKYVLNLTIVVLLCFIFVGNIIPNISRMGDIGRAITFLRAEQTARYFMPPPYVESADAVRKFTKQDVVYCGDGKVSADMLAPEKNYLIVSDLFPSLNLSGVKTSTEVYSNKTWKVFELKREDGHEEALRISFPKNMVQQLKVKIREM